LTLLLAEVMSASLAIRPATCHGEKLLQLCHGHARTPEAWVMGGVSGCMSCKQTVLNI
jgi:hypothetical protein